MSFPRSNKRRQLRVEGLEPRTMLAGDVVAAADQVAATPEIAGDANRDGVFDQSDLVEVFQAGKYDTDEAADWSQSAVYTGLVNVRRDCLTGAILAPDVTSEVRQNDTEIDQSSTASQHANRLQHESGKRSAVGAPLATPP